jgi:hypothetical protein
MMQLLNKADELLLSFLVDLLPVLKGEVALRRLLTVWRCG